MYVGLNKSNDGFENEMYKKCIYIISLLLKIKTVKCPCPSSSAALHSFFITRLKMQAFERVKRPQKYFVVLLLYPLLGHVSLKATFFY
jgi:hypothetical protein